MKCKHCGSDIGFFAKIRGVQYYDENAEPQGFEVDTQGCSIYCRNCNKRTFSASEFLRRGNNYEKTSA